jgi:hypothetical protein
MITNNTQPKRQNNGQKRKKRKRKNMSDSSGNNNNDKNSKSFNIHDFNDCQSVLILGEGDMSFSNALLIQRKKTHPRNPFKLVMATTYDSYQTLKEKYHDNFVDKIKKFPNVVVKHSVDATKLSQSIDNKKFDAIVFNYPHTGEQRTHLNRNLIREAFSSSAFYLNTNRKCYYFLTMKNFLPYTEWKHVESATSSGLILVKKKKFMEKLWPTYVHQTTLLDAKEVDSKKSLTYVFCPQVEGRLFSKIEREKQIKIEAENSKDTSSPTSVDNIRKQTTDHVADNTNSSSNSSFRKRKRARKKKKKSSTSLLDKDFIEVPESSSIEWTTAGSDWGEVKGWTS